MAVSFLKILVLKPNLWLKVVNGKRRQVLVSALIAIFALPKEKRPVTVLARNRTLVLVVFSEDDQVLEALNMTEKIDKQTTWGRGG